MISLNYTTTNDYTPLNPPKFNPVLSKYNTLLLTKDMVDKNKLLKSDKITILQNNKRITQYLGYSFGDIRLFDMDFIYVYFYPGIDIDPISNSYQIKFDEKTVPLSTYLDPTYTNKIITGYLVLNNNYRHIYQNANKAVISLEDKKDKLVNIIKCENKANVFMGGINNTVLHILDSSNTEALMDINTSQNPRIRPINNPNYPLGSLEINGSGVSNSRLKINNQILNFSSRYVKIENLRAGIYTVSLVDNNGLSPTINRINNRDFGSNKFDIRINAVNPEKTNSSTSFFDQQIAVKSGLGNLIVNLAPYSTSFTLFGNGLRKKYNAGYKKIVNLLPGNYKIEYQNKTQDILILPNKNNYFSNRNN